MGEAEIAAYSIPGGEEVAKAARKQALREALEQIGAIKLKYAIFGRPDDGQLEKVITEIEAKIDEMIAKETINAKN